MSTCGDVESLLCVYTPSNCVYVSDCQVAQYFCTCAGAKHVHDSNPSGRKAILQPNNLPTKLELIHLPQKVLILCELPLFDQT